MMKLPWRLMKRFHSCYNFQLPTSKPHCLKLCPRDSLKIMICLISTGFTVAARASCFHLHYILWSNIFMDNPGLNAAMVFCPWALWQICRKWNTKEQHILEKLHTECWTCVTPRSRSKAKPFNGLCLKSYIVWGGFLLSIMEIHFCIYKIRMCICVYVCVYRQLKTEKEKKRGEAWWKYSKVGREHVCLRTRDILMLLWHFRK